MIISDSLPVKFLIKFYRFNNIIIGMNSSAIFLYEISSAA